MNLVLKYLSTYCRPRRILVLTCVAVALFTSYHLFKDFLFEGDEVVVPKNVAVQHTNSHRLAVLVPYRDRSDELAVFVPHISDFLEKQHVSFKIFVLNQTDKFRFNRAALINIGFVLSQEQGFDYLVMHDIDLLPLDSRLSYEFPVNGPMHISSPKLHPLYHYESYVGGILVITHDHFKSINGMSNRYWGWGQEDDEFYVRMRRANLKMSRPSFKSSTAFRHNHDRSKRKRDFRKKIPALAKVDSVTGISSLGVDGPNGSLYSILRNYNLEFGKYSCLVYDIVLQCHTVVTPWCLPSKR